MSLQTCLRCGAKFEIADWRIKKGGGKYCSRECFYSSQVGREKPSLRKRVERTCCVCGKKFEAGGRSSNRNKQSIFCSHECANQARFREGGISKALSIADAAYLGGLVDGEGSIFLYSRGGVASLRLAIANTNLGVLEWVKEVTGVGAVITSNRNDPRHKAQNIWAANSGAAQSVIEQIAPFLRIKLAQANLAIETRKKLADPALKADRTWQAEAIQGMKKLNRRGPDREQSTGDQA